jgi:hypothetical protein
MMMLVALKRLLLLRLFCRERELIILLVSREIGDDGRSYLANLVWKRTARSRGSMASAGGLRKGGKKTQDWCVYHAAAVRPASRSRSVLPIFEVSLCVNVQAD